jgi:hypothetical protein
MVDIFRGVGVEISLISPDNFLKVCETLSRIGVSSRKDKILYQSCHILHKREYSILEGGGKSYVSRYAILHFKELFILDGKPTDICENDYGRRNVIARLLEEWKLVKVLNAGSLMPLAPLHQIKIITHKEKPEWQLIPKYTIGKKT